MKNKFYITTAIAYPNSVPHLGHALEIVQTDVIARFHKLLGDDVWFQTGTDEHGTKNWETAKKKGKTISQFLDENVDAFKKLYKELNISYDYFIRTTDKKIHHPGAIELWNNLIKAGDIYKKKYEGLYCVGCESFKVKRELIDDKCSHHPKLKIKVVNEENYFFRLSKYKNELFEKISSDEYKVIPKKRKNEILSFLKDAKDISFSRPKKSLPWGISVPGDDEQVMYVWCDALSNYITGIGYGRDKKKFDKLWPADVHIIGKDILRFHAAFWPAMLLSANISLPKKLLVHGFILSSGAKMSKSSGNVIEPFSQIEKYGSEIFKFYLIETMPLESDGEYSEELLVERVNTELVGNLANFIYRTLSFLNKNFDGSMIIAKDDEFTDLIESKFKEAKSFYENYDLRNALNTILRISAIGNKYFQDNEPWALIKKDKKKAHEVLSLSTNLVKNLIILLKPIMPMFANNVEKQLNLKNLVFTDLNFDLKNHKIGIADILFRKIELVKSEEKKSVFSKLDLKVAKIVDVKNHPNADKLYLIELDCGEKRRIVSGLKDFYSVDDLKGKNILLLYNLQPAKIRGEKSEGMLLAADTGDKIGLLFAEKSKPGDQVFVDGISNCSKQISYKEFSEVKIKSENGKAYFEGKPLKTSSETVFVDKKVDGNIC